MSFHLTACARSALHQADNLAKLWLESLSVFELIAQILCAVSSAKIKQGSRQHANLRVAVASAMICVLFYVTYNVADGFECGDFVVVCREAVFVLNRHNERYDVEAVKSQIFYNVALERNVVAIFAEFGFHNVFNFVENHISLLLFVILLYHSL